MNKGDLINEIAQIVATKKQAQEVVDTVFSVITNSLKKNEPVQIAGFGSFKTAKREARTGRNPPDRRRNSNRRQDRSQVRTGKSAQRRAEIAVSFHSEKNEGRALALPFLCPAEPQARLHLVRIDFHQGGC